MNDRVRPISPPLSTGHEPLSSAWIEFIRFCRELGFGEIEQLKIQDGVPVLAELIRKKVKFTNVR